MNKDVSLNDNINSWPNVSIVVVGHNESKNLLESLLAIKKLDYPPECIEIIYVDSNSTDNSLEIASNIADISVSVKSKYPSAGEAFNAGIIATSNNYIWISGGDIILDPKFLKNAISTLFMRRDISAVTGYWIEREKRGWNKVLGYISLEHSKKNGEFITDAPNGGVFKKKVLIDLDGYDERINKGQETELGERMKAGGHNILNLNIPQGKHDHDMFNTMQVIRRYYVEGKSSCRVLLLPTDVGYNNYFKRAKMNAAKRLIENSLLIVTLIILLWLKLYTLLIVLPVGYCLIKFLRLYYKIVLKARNQKYFIFRLVSLVADPIRYLGMLSFILQIMPYKSRNIDILGGKLGLSRIDKGNAKFIIYRR